MELTEQDVTNLKAIRERIKATKRMVQRKRKIRDSERAMWASDLQSQTYTISKVIAHGSYLLQQKGGTNG